MAANYYKQMRATTKATKTILRQSRMQGFVQTNSALGAIEGNLRTTLASGKAAMNKDQSRVLGQLRNAQRFQDRNSQKATNRAYAQTGGMYGSATRGAMGSSLRAIDNYGQSETRRGNPLTSAGGILARGNQMAQATLAKGATMARAGADAALADALQYRAKDDAALIAQQQYELQKMRLQNKLDIQNYKAKLALEEDKAASLTGATALAGLAGDGVQQLQNIFANPDNAAGDANGYVTAAEALAVWSAQTGYGEETVQYQVMQTVANAIRNGHDAAAAAGTGIDPTVISDSVTQAIAMQYPDMSPTQVESLRGVILGNQNEWVFNNGANQERSENYAAGAGDDTISAYRDVAKDKKKFDELVRQGVSPDVALAYSS